MIEKGAFSKLKLKISFNKKRIWATAFIVIGYSITFYLFFLFWREMLRYQTLNEYGEMMVLTPVETYFYNFFYAGLAILTGLSFGAYSLFTTQFRLPGQVRHTITNNFSGLQWYFVYIITKLGVFYGIFSWSGELYLFVSLYEEFWFLFPLILIVLALHQWIKIRVFFRNSFKLMILSLTGVIFFAGILAAIPFFDYKSFNHSVLKQTVGYNYTIDLPNAESSKGYLRMSLIEDLYIGYPKKGNIDSAVVVVKNNLIPLTKNNLSEWLKRSKNNSGDFGSRPLTIAFRCDRNVKTGDVIAIIDLLRENDIRLLTFMTDQRRG
ncbi:MAG TPA: hypothetical protein PLJ08_12170, partial [Cyclobacteriaceae bacterium]|nr:hypothetical protein [Cyclobacteriaceae bacterium]